MKSNSVSPEWRLETEVLEIRYPREYRYWDLTGSIAMAILKLNSALGVVKADAGKTTLTSPEEGVTLMFGPDMSSVAQNLEYTPKTHIRAFADGFFERVLATLNVSKLTRIGHRLTYRKHFDFEEEAKSYLRKLVETHDCGKNFLQATGDERLIRKRPISLTIVFADDSTGVRVELETGNQVLSVPNSLKSQLPSGFKSTLYTVTCDLDIFTRGDVDADSFAAAELMKGNAKMAETRILEMLK